MTLKVLTALGLLMGLVIAAAGVAKVADLGAFENGLRAQGAGPFFSTAIAVVVPWAEIIAGAGLFLHAWRGTAALLSAALWLGFASWHGYRLYAGILRPCHCAGNVQIPSGPPAMIAAACLLVAALNIYLAVKWSDNRAA
jgi:uncharacterized membrane protein YphA (DoxX/SURF4 family)